MTTVVLTWSGGFAHAQCVTTGTTVNCTGSDPSVLDGITDGVDFFAPPVDTINVFDILGDIAPAPGISGVSAETIGTGLPLTVSVDTGVFQIDTHGSQASGIRLQTQRINSPIDLTNHAAIDTHGERAHGLLAVATNSDSPLTVRNYNTITTKGEFAFGMRLTTGEAGGPPTNMPIDLINEGAITTSGDAAFGIRARSIGEDSPIKINNSGTIETQGGSSIGIFATADRKLSTIGNSIELTNSGAITVEGRELGVSERTSGIHAQSGGDGGGILITNEGVITTLGNDVVGIYATSVGVGASITVNNQEAITIAGNRTFPSSSIPALSGILALSLDADSPIVINNSADVTANGAGSNGIYAFSLDVSSKVTVNLLGGVVQGGSGDGNGIDLTPPTAFGSGVANVGTVNVSAGAAVTTLGANAVRGGAGHDTVNNWGIVTGNVELGGGTNAFNNMVGGLFNAGSTVNLGAANALSNAGTLSPGGTGSVQTTGLTGDIVFNAGSTYEVEVDGTSNDRISASGTATVNGGTVRVSGVPLIGMDYTILSAEDDLVVNTEFDLSADTGTTFFAYALEYNDILNHVILTTTRIASFCDTAGTANQQAVACDGLDSLPLTNDIVQAVLALTTQEETRGAFDALSGEAHASLKGALMENGQALVDAVNRRMNAGFGNPDTAISTAAFGSLSSLADGNNGFWITGYGSWGETDATANTAQMDNDLGGVVFGIDREFAEIWRVGVLGGYGRSNVSQNALQSSATADTWSIGLYGGAEAGANVLSFGAVYNWHAIDTARTVSFPGVAQALSASYDAQSWQLFAEASHKVQVDRLMLEPFAGVSFISLDTDGYTETGGSAALTAASDTQDTTFTTLGVRSSMQVMDTVHARGMIGWRHAFGDVDPSSTFTLAGSNPFTITGAPIAQDALVTELGLEAELSRNAFLGASYNGQYGDGTTMHGFNARFRARF